MFTCVDLIPNRNLGDSSSFEGYKLSLDPIPIYERQLEIGVHTVQPGDSQFSFSHAKVFSLHNYLHSSQHLPDHVYYVDDKWHIHQITVNSLNRIQDVSVVGRIPINRQQKQKDFPITILFASENIAVISDGTGWIHFAKTDKSEWTIVFSTDLTTQPQDLMNVFRDGNCITIVVRSILEPKFESFLKFVTFDEHFKIVNEKSLQVPGVLDYASLETPNTAIIICPTMPTFSNDTEATQKVKYQWSQTATDVTICIEIETASPEVDVSLNEKQIYIKLDGKEVLSGDLFEQGTNPKWSLEKGRFSLIIQKNEHNMPWKEFLKGDNNGVQVQIFEDEASDQMFPHEKLEEVDMATQSSLLRIDLDKSSVTHKVDLSTSRFLFPANVDVNKPSALCLRHLSDAFVWQFEDCDDNWKHTHMGTFSAFGYAQASKTERKFIVAPPDLSYVVICDAFRHLYIYRQPTAVNGTLRNRTSGERIKAIAKLQLVNLETSDEVLGIRATGNKCFVLTKNKLFVVVINE